MWERQNLEVNLVDFLLGAINFPITFKDLLQTLQSGLLVGKVFGIQKAACSGCVDEETIGLLTELVNVCLINPVLRDAVLFGDLGQGVREIERDVVRRTVLFRRCLHFIEKDLSVQDARKPFKASNKVLVSSAGNQEPKLDLMEMLKSREHFEEFLGFCSLQALIQCVNHNHESNRQICLLIKDRERLNNQMSELLRWCLRPNRQSLIYGTDDV
ncbi:hypothetical protein FSOLCH5_001931 [Fusarium solani]